MVSAQAKAWVPREIEIWTLVQAKKINKEKKWQEMI